MAQETLPWQPILGSKLVEIGLFTFIRRAGIPKQTDCNIAILA